MIPFNKPFLTGKETHYIYEAVNSGKGYDTMLLEKLERYCEENKIVELQIPTQNGNQLACQFYNKLGYILIQEISIKDYWKL
jgi:ribosomal protein S18 acetylase RimI-like enzyme